MEAIRVGAYARVSTSNQVRANDSSVDTQLQLIRSKVNFECEQARVSKDRREWKVVAEYREEGRSAKNTDRPELKRLMADIAAGKIDVVCVTKIDRITRSLIDFYELWAMFEKHGVEFVALSDSFETRSATGKAMLKITLVFAELERERTSERTKEKIQSRRQQGMWFGGRVPLGYQIDPANKTTLKVDEKVAKMVRKDFFERYLKLKTVRALTRDLARRGITRPKGTTKHGKATGGGGFMVPSVVQILSNSLYVAKREVEGGKLLDCVWDPIIEPELFERVQAQMARNREKRPTGRASPSYTFLLEGLIRCGSCGSMMTHASANGTGGTYFYYKCNRKSRSVGEACKARDVPAPAAEKFVLAELRKTATDLKAVKAAVRRTNEGRDEELKRIEAELKEKRFASQEQGRAIQKLVNAFEDEAAPTLLKSLKTRLIEHEASQDQLKVEIANLEAKRLDLKQKMLDAEVVAEGFRKIPMLIDHAQKKGYREDLKTLLRGVVDRIEWRHNPDDPKKGDAAVRLFELPTGWAHPGEKKGQPDEPLISSPGRPEWLPTLAQRENFLAAFELCGEEPRKWRRSKRIGPPKVVRFLAMAEEFQALLEAGKVRSRAELARRNDLQRARVTQLMGLLELHPVIREFVRGLGEEVPDRAVTERKLKVLTSLGPSAQLVAARNRLPGFAAFESARAQKTGPDNRSPVPAKLNMLRRSAVEGS